MTTKTPIPPWLKQHLIDTGTWTTDGTTRKAKLQTHTCGQLVLYGLDADTCAGTTTVDPLPLTPLGEAFALIQNRHTYDYRPNTQELEHRDQHMIRQGFLNGIQVLAQHICEQMPLPHTIPATPLIQEASDDCPY